MTATTTANVRRAMILFLDAHLDNDLDPTGYAHRSILYGAENAFVSAEDTPADPIITAVANAYERVIRYVAAIHHNHPEYKSEWRP